MTYASVATITEDAADIGVSAVNITDALAITANAAATITGAITEANIVLINAATTGDVTVTDAITTGAFDLSTSLGDLAGITGLTTIDAATDGVATAMTITAADLFAANDGVSNVSLTIDATIAEDTLSLIGWTGGANDSGGAGYTAYTIGSVGDGGDDTYTVNVTNDTAVTVV